MDISERNIRATRYALIGRGTSAALLFLVSILVARYLGPEAFGELALAMTIIVFLSVIADGGMNRSAQIHISQHLQEEPEAVAFSCRRFLWIKIGIAGVAFLLTYLLAPWMAEVYGIAVLEPLIKTGGILLAALIIFEYQISVVQGYESFRSLCMAMVFDAGFRLIAILAVIALGLGVVGIMTGYAAATLIVSALLVLITSIIIITFPSTENPDIKNYVPDILRYSPPLLVSTLFFIAYTKFDILALGYFGIASDVGYYSLAVGLIDNLIIPLAAIEIAILPIVASAYGRASQKTDMNRIFNQVITMGFLFMMPVITGVTVVAHLFVTTVYGPAYQNTALILMILTPYIFTKTLGVLNGTYLIAAREARRFMWYMFGAVILNSSLLLVFIPQWGTVGAAFAKIATHTLLTGLMLGYVMKRFEIKVEFEALVRITKICLSAVLMGLICFVVVSITPAGVAGLVLTILSGIIVYLLLIHLSGTLPFRQMLKIVLGDIGLQLDS